MSPSEAEQFIEWWQTQSPKEDLIVRDNGKMVPTDVGKRAVVWFSRGEFSEVTLHQARSAAADARIERKDYARLADIVKILREHASEHPASAPKLEGWTAEDHGRAIYFDRDVRFWGIAETDCTHPVLWFIMQRFGPYHTRYRPEWTMMPPAMVPNYTIMRASDADSAAMKAKWWAMHEKNEFETTGPFVLYAPRTANRTATEIREQLAAWVTTRRQTAFGKHAEPQRLAAIMAPGLADPPMTAGMREIESKRAEIRAAEQKAKDNGIAGSHIGWTPDPKDDIPY